MSPHYTLLALIVYSIHRKKKGLGSSYHVGVMSKITDWRRKRVRLDRQWHITHVENFPGLSLPQAFLSIFYAFILGSKKEVAFFSFVFHTLEITVFGPTKQEKVSSLFFWQVAPLLSNHQIHNNISVCDECSQRLSSPFLHAVGDQKLDCGKVWEWG